MGDEVTFLDTQINVMKDERNEEQESYILVPRMYSKETYTHQYLATNSCHPDHVSKNITTNVVHRCRMNCLDKVKDDSLFKDSLVTYKAYLFKSGYLQENIDKKFIKFALSNKRKNIHILQNKRKQKKSSVIKYRFITEFEPKFPNIRKGLWKFERIIKEDEVLSKVFPKGAKHFQVSEKRGSKNIKELLAPSSVILSSEEHLGKYQQGKGSYPCNKPCAYCTLLRKSQATHFKSRSNGQSFKIRQKINCQSENVIYLIECKQCKIQGIGQTFKLNSKLWNYFSHIKQRERTCHIVNHFIDSHMDTWKDDYEKNDLFSVMGVVQLENPLKNKKAKVKIIKKPYSVEKKKETYLAL